MHVNDRANKIRHLSGHQVYANVSVDHQDNRIDPTLTLLHMTSELDT